MANAVRRPDTSPLGAIEINTTSPPPAFSANCSDISTPYASESSRMSLPERSSVWSASSFPGTAGSGICFTQTAMFIRSLRVRARRRTGHAA